MKKRVLWIEDNALSDLQNVLGPIYMDGHYDLVIAENASEGMSRLTREVFDAVIVDIRLPPGEDNDWIKLYNDRPYGARPRLGLLLLYSLFYPKEAAVNFGEMPKWIRPERFGVFSVESKAELKQDLDKLKISVYEQKTAATSTRIILDLLERIARNCSGRE
jgi:hypothetical protein